MPQIDIDGANSKISADTIRGQSGTTVTVQAGHNLVGSGSGLTALSAANLTGTLPAISGANLTSLPAHTGNVAFPATQVASAEANTLDDYEQGTFTIGQTFSSGSATITSQAAHYTKIGQLVAIQANFSVGTPSSPSGTWTVTGLPFTILSGQTAYFYVTLWNTLPSATQSSFFAQYSGGTSFPFWEADNSATRAGSSGAYANHGVAGSPYVGFNFTYITA